MRFGFRSRTSILWMATRRREDEVYTYFEYTLCKRDYYNNASRAIMKPFAIIYHTSVVLARLHTRFIIHTFSIEQLRTLHSAS